MNEEKGFREYDRLDGCIIMALALPLLFLVVHFSAMDRAIIAWASAVCIGLIVFSYWNYRKRLDFWIAIPAYILFHAAAVYFIPDSWATYFAAHIKALGLPVFVADLALMFWLFPLYGDADRDSARAEAEHES